MSVIGKDYASKEFLGLGDPLKKAKPEEPKKGSPSRRRFLTALGVGTSAMVLFGAAIPNPVRDYLVDFARRATIEEATAGKDNDGVYAEFRGKRFRIVREPINLSQGDTLDDKLYTLNNKFNPDLRIKGDKLETLQELFHAMNRNPNVLGNLTLGETRKIQYRPGVVTQIRDGYYHFPIYSLR